MAVLTLPSNFMVNVDVACRETKTAALTSNLMHSFQSMVMTLPVAFGVAFGAALALPNRTGTSGPLMPLIAAPLHGRIATLEAG